MNLHEYQAKNLLMQYHLPIPNGYICNTIDDIDQAIFKLGDGPWIAKCQVHAGGRGQAGGIQIINYKQDLKNFFKKWLGKLFITIQTDNNGKLVNKILIENVINIKKEMYISIFIDRSVNTAVFMASSYGGINIEKILKKNPHFIYKIYLDVFLGPQCYQARNLAYELGLHGKQIEQFIKIFMGISNLFFNKDLTLIEVNPLVVDHQDNLICLDTKINFDINAQCRQLEILHMKDTSQENTRETHAAKFKLNYVALKGNIGCIVNGAGLAMSTMDMIKLHGGNPANFLDIGGNISPETIFEAFKIILSDKEVKAIFVNIFGGIVKCDLIADGLLYFIEKQDLHIPIIVRLVGNNSENGIKKLLNKKDNIIVHTDLMDAINKVIQVAGESTCQF